jgi:hypothetical protein
MGFLEETFTGKQILQFISYIVIVIISIAILIFVILAKLAFLNANSGGFTVVFSLVVAGATAAYALFTWKLVGVTAEYAKRSKELVEETIKIRKMQDEPCISIYAEPDPSVLFDVNLFIHNTGLGPAYNVKFSVIEDIVYIDDGVGKHNSVFSPIKEGLKELNLFKHPWKYFEKGQRIGFHLANLSEDISSAARYVTPLRIVATYENRLQEERKNESVIDLTPLFGYYGLRPVRAPYIQLHREMLRIATSLEGCIYKDNYPKEEFLPVSPLKELVKAVEQLAPEKEGDSEAEK